MENILSQSNIARVVYDFACKCGYETCLCHVVVVRPPAASRGALGGRRPARGVRGYATPGQGSKGLRVKNLAPVIPSFQEGSGEVAQ